MQKSKGKKKINSTKTLYNGYLYDSKKEASQARNYDLQLKGGEILKWEKQVVFRFPLDCKRPPKFTLDFVVTLKNGNIEYVDTKPKRKDGTFFLTDIYKLKKKMIEHFFGIRIIEV